MDAPLTSYAFESKHIDRMVHHKYKLNEDIRHLFISVDPSAGKDGNFYVMTSTVYTKSGTCVVCFLSLSLSLYSVLNIYRESQASEM
jgi:hypothetical protein